MPHFLKGDFAVFLAPLLKLILTSDKSVPFFLRISTSETLYHSVRQVPLTKYVENKFSYTKSLLGGFQNEAVFLVKYDGLNIVEVE